MELVPVVAGAPNLVLNTWGALTFWHRQQGQTRRPGEVQYLANLVAADYDAAGRGLPGTAAWGWALCNGQHGTADLRGQFVAGLDPARADYDAVGKTGGAAHVTLLTAQLSFHSHGMGTAASDNTGRTGTGDTYAKSAGSNPGLDHTRRTTETGGNQPHENRPPFFVLAVVQWVGY